ncbi:g5046 [Coccomyxa elongata]
MPRGGLEEEETLQCLSMHQPWASLLVHGIKRVEGRSWPTQHRGRLWIASTAQEASPEAIQEMEAFYTYIHGLEGNVPNFPQHYPRGVLLGCVYVANCLSAEELQRVDTLPEGLTRETESDFCFLCERPARLIVPQQVKGQHKIWPLPAATAKQFGPALKPVPQVGEQPFTWSRYGLDATEKQRETTARRRIL